MLEKSGKVVVVNMVMHPKQRRLVIEPGDPLSPKLHLSNGIKKHFKTKVT